MSEAVPSEGEVVRPSWAADPHARRLRELWPACVPERAIDEEWWRWREHDVHLDRVRPDAGAATGLSVVLVHGGGGHGRLLAPIAAALAVAGHETVAPDLPGLGLTRCPDGAPLTYETWVALVASLAAAEAARRGRRVALLGLSLGGTTALHAAARTDAVAGVAATTLLDLRDAEVRAAIARSGLVARVGGELVARAAPLLDGVRLPVAWVAPFSRMGADPRLGAWLAEDPHVGRARLPLGFWRSLAAQDPAIEPEGFGKPVLLAHPGDDAWTPPALSLRVFERLAGPKRYVLLDGGGHAPLEPAPLAQLVGAVTAFLAELGGAPAR